MPNYTYFCEICNRKKDVFHSISECDVPNNDTLLKITCCNSTMKRQVFAPNIQGMYGGSSVSGKEKRDTIQKERKERSHKDFRKNIYPTLSRREKKYFDNKEKKK